MKTATTIFGNGCIKSIYKILDIKIPKKVKEVVEFSEFKTAKKVELKQAYTLYKKEDK